MTHRYLELRGGYRGGLESAGEGGGTLALPCRLALRTLCDVCWFHLWFHAPEDAYWGY